MTAFDGFSRQTASGDPQMRALRQELRAAIDAIAEKHGVHLALTRLDINDGVLCGRIGGQSADVPSAEEVAFDRNAYLLGIHPAALNKSIDLNGNRYSVKGLQERGSRIVLERSGQRFLVAPAVVANVFPLPAMGAR